MDNLSSHAIGFDLAHIREYPSSFEAEKSILGAFLLDPTLIEIYIERLHSDDFFFDATRHIFITIKNRYFGFLNVIACIRY